MAESSEPERFTPQIRLTYTELSGMTPPEQGALIRVGGDSGRLLRVVNEPKWVDGAFTLEVESVDDRG